MTTAITHVVLHQSGKVGSTALQAALATAAPGLAVLKSHFLSPHYIEFFQALASRSDSPPRLRRGLATQVENARQIRGMLSAVPPHECCILGGVRDPLSFAISAFFQNLTFFEPGMNFQPGDLDAEVVRLTARFHDLFSCCRTDCPDDPLSLYAKWVLGGAAVDWYRDDYSPTYGLPAWPMASMDTSVVRFRHAGRFHIVYRFEAFPACLDAVFQWLCRGPIVPAVSNMSVAKPYARLYAAFKSRFRPAAAMWDYYYESPFFRCFYPGEPPAYRRPLSVYRPTTITPQSALPADRPATRKAAGQPQLRVAAADGPPETTAGGRLNSPTVLRDEAGTEQQRSSPMNDTSGRPEVYVPHAGWLAFPAEDRVAHNLLEGWFETLEQAFLWRFARDGDVFVDCGAHVGLFTLAAASAAGPSSRILALEPLPGNAELLRRNVAANQLQGVEILQAAVGSHLGRTRLYGGVEGMTAWSTMFPPVKATNALPAAQEAQPHDVPLITLDSVIESHAWPHVAFVKIDVEGAEAEVLAGFEKTLAARSVGVLMIEFTEGNLRRAGLDTRTLFEAITARGLTCCRFDPDTAQLHPVHYNGPIAYENLFATFDVDAVNRRLHDAPPGQMRIASSLIEQWRVRQTTASLGKELQEARGSRQAADRRLKEMNQRRQMAENQLRLTEQRLGRAQIRLKQMKHALEVAEGRQPLEQLVRQTERRLIVAEQRCEEAERRLEATARSLSEAEDGRVQQCRRASRAEAAIAHFQRISEQLQASRNYRWLEKFFPGLRQWRDAVNGAFEKYGSNRSLGEPTQGQTGQTATDDTAAADVAAVLPVPGSVEPDSAKTDQRKAA